MSKKLTAFAAAAVLALATVALATPGIHSSEEPTVVRAVAPLFPLPEKERPLQSGAVIVEVKLDSSGAVTSAHAVQGPPDLYYVAENAAKRWQFSSVEGESQLRSVNLSFRFKWMDDGTAEDDLATVYTPPFQVEVRRIAPLIIRERA